MESTFIGNMLTLAGGICYVYVQKPYQEKAQHTMHLKWLELPLDL